MSWVINLGWVALGGALGAVARFLLSSLIHLFADKSFPLGVLFVNILGSFLMGYFSLVLLERLPYSVELRSFLLIGLIGAFTTFSTFSLDTINLLENGHWLAAGLNVLLSVVLCLLASGFGLYMGKITG